MKRILAIFVLALFAVGMLPAAFAEDTSAGTADSEDAAADDSAADAPAGRANGKLRDKIENRRQALGNAGEKALENRELMIAAKDELLAKHEARVAELIERCRETGKTEEECKAQFQQRLENIAALAPKFREKLKEFEDKRDERIQKLKELKNDNFLGKFERGKEFKARMLDEVKLGKAQANFAKARGKYQEALVGLDKAKLRLEQAKTSKVCKTAPDSEECNKAREELRASAKEKLVKHADIIIGSLEKAKEKANASEYLSDEEAAKAISFFEEQIKKFGEIKAEIEKAQTKEEIVAAAKKLSDAWKEVKHKVNAYLHFIANSRMAGIVVKAEHLAAKLERVLERMAENGKDTTAVEPLVAEFKAELGLAEEKFKAAHSLLLEARTQELADETKAAKVQEAQKLLKDAKDALKDANALLRQIFQKLKDANALPELAAATEAEELEAAEEASEAEEAEPAEAAETPEGSEAAA